jgi:hypothetical protein
LTRGEVRHSGPTEKAFEDEQMIAEAGLEQPHVTALSLGLGLGICVDEPGFLSQLSLERGWRNSPEVG